MRIHSDVLTILDLFDAEKIARVSLYYTVQGSRSRSQSFDVTLTGESRRRPNSGKRGAGWSSEYAATWDQWGVFLAVLFDRDPSMLCGTAKRPIYDGENHFHMNTDGRFDRDEEMGWWPEDAHGDHTFQYSGIVGLHQCTKCTAKKRWL